MRGSSLSPVLARVERLAAAWPSSPETTFIHWVHEYERCPSCGADLAELARASALAKAVKGAAPGALPPGFVFYAIDDELTACPRCGAPLPRRPRRPAAAGAPTSSTATS